MKNLSIVVSSVAAALLAGMILGQEAAKPSDPNVALKNLAVAQMRVLALRANCEIQINATPQADELKKAQQEAIRACQAVKKVLDDQAYECKEPLPPPSDVKK